MCSSDLSVALLHDADAKQLRWDPLQAPDKDLGKRFRDFAKAVTGFRRSVGSQVPKVWYKTIDTAWLEKAKGLDDLIDAEGEEQVLPRLFDAQRSNTYFNAHDITEADWRAINGVFDLNIFRGVPTSFYEAHRAQIGEREFNFLGGRYQSQKDEEDGSQKLVQLLHPDSKHYIIVGGEFYKHVLQEDETGKPTPKLERWEKWRIDMEYVKNGVPNFIRTLDRFDGFTNKPGHHDDYQPIVLVKAEEFGPVTRLHNRYARITHLVKKGGMPNILYYLQHCFGDHDVHTIDNGATVATSKSYEVYMDRWSLMYRHPRQRVPATVLVSKEFETGKSTLLWLNLAMWESNAVVIGGEAFTSNFNVHWVDKKYVGVDEALVNKREDGEKLKTTITAPVIQRRGMYRDSESGSNFTTFDLTSNNEHGFLSIGQDEYRYFVNKVPVLQRKDPMLLKKMIAEIPALFYELRNRDIIHPNMSRLWFADSVLDTQARRVVADNSRRLVEKDLREWITEQFYNYRWPELYFNITQIRELLNRDNATRYGQFQLAQVLRDDWKVPEHKGWVDRPLLPADRRKGEAQGQLTCCESANGRWYVFRAQDYADAEYADMWLKEAQAEWRLSTNGLNSGGGYEAFKLHHPK